MGVEAGKDRQGHPSNLFGAWLLAVALHGLYDVFLMHPGLPWGGIFPVLLVAGLLVRRGLREARRLDDRRPLWERAEFNE